MKYFVIFIGLIGFTGSAFAQNMGDGPDDIWLPSCPVGTGAQCNQSSLFHDAISEPFSKSDSVAIGKVVQKENQEQNSIKYSISVDFYLKNYQPFDLLTANLNDAPEPQTFPEVLYYNSPVFNEGDLVFVYLKKIGGQYNMLQESFALDKQEVRGPPPTILLNHSPLEKNFVQGKEIVVAGEVRKMELVKAAKEGTQLGVKLSLHDEDKNVIFSDGIDIGVDGSYSYSLDTSNIPPGKYDVEVNYGPQTTGTEITIEFNSKYWTPLKQSKTGISFDKIQCKENLVLLQKYDGTPACVKKETKQKLVERGWTLKKTPENVKQETIVYTGPADIPSANNHFALLFYSEISKDDKQGNLFFSPTSIFTAFAMAYEGAKEDTAKELQQVFGFEEAAQKRQSGFAQMMNRFDQNTESYKLQMANGLWVAQHFEPKSQYVDTAMSNYNSTVESVDFVTDDGVNKINEWVKEKTNQKIKEILTPGSTDELTAMVITNAMYFMGKWSSQFSPDNTTEENFWIDNENSVKAQMMRIEADRFNYAETDDLQIIELNYLGGEVSMLILLPQEAGNIHSVEDSLDVKYIKELKEKMAFQPLTIAIPKFEFETQYPLIPTLENLGVNLAFDGDYADFRGITDKQIFIDQAIHKTFVGVDEEGTEAAAITALVFQLTSGPPTPEHEFIADHPFIFLIQEKETGQILFMGRVMDPT